MTRIKCCGLFRPEDIQAVNQARPDYVGFVFAKSPRQVDPARARVLKELLHPAIVAVGVFVNAPVEKILFLTQSGIIDGIQLHGEESTATIKDLQRKTGLPVIKAAKITDERSLEDLQDCPADFLLLDAASAGSGRPFDWSLFKGLSRPFFLAGGLKEDNLHQAIEHFKPYAVDLSSGLETAGLKDPEKIKRTVRMVRGS